MKILICASEYFPHGSGIANVAYNVVELLKRQGFECIICSPSGPDIKLGSQKLIEKTGIIGLLYFWYCVSRYVNSDSYDAIWVHNPLFLTEKTDWKCLVTMHSTYYGEAIHGVGTDPFLCFYKKLASYIERYCLTNMSKKTTFTGVSKPICEEIKNIGIPDNNVFFIPNGVNTSQFKPSYNKKEIRKKFGIPLNHIVLLSVGRLTPAKQPLLMIDIFSQISQNLKNITLCIAGTGELLDSTKEHAHQVGLKNIIFLGFVNHNIDLPELYSCADYYIMTSKYEGAPLTLIEAMSCGLPCIVSNIPNLGIVEEANCGIVLNFNDSTSTKNKIIEYIKKDITNNSQNARKFALTQLEWSFIAEKYNNLLRNLQ